jgi:hypothetical protein
VKGLHRLAYALTGPRTTIRFPDGRVVEMGLVEGLQWLASLPPEDYEVQPSPTVMTCLTRPEKS